ncbi:MAG: hypothetical protein ACXADH_12390, partial [Candidatus Kariarchaeaceae archaeon]
MKYRIIPISLILLLVMGVLLVNSVSTTGTSEQNNMDRSYRPASPTLNQAGDFWYHESTYLDVQPDGRLWGRASLDGSAI